MKAYKGPMLTKHKHFSQHLKQHKPSYKPYKKGLCFTPVTKTSQLLLWLANWQIPFKPGLTKTYSIIFYSPKYEQHNREKNCIPLFPACHWEKELSIKIRAPLEEKFIYPPLSFSLSLSGSSSNFWLLGHHVSPADRMDLWVERGEEEGRRRERERDGGIGRGRGMVGEVKKREGGGRGMERERESKQVR